MDVEKIKKLVEENFEADKLVKAVTAVKNEVKNKEQMRDVVMSDHFKTLREPLIEQQKKTDEKQDKVIEQLQKNQLALTGGIQDIISLNRELPQIAPEEMQELAITPKEEKVFIANIGKRFDEKDMVIIDELGLIKPSELLKSDPSHLIKYREDVKKMEKYTTHAIIGLKNTKKKDVSQELKEQERERKTIDAYSQTINDIINLKTNYLSPKKGKGVKYKQPKRNAYKIQDGGYGGLVIDLPKLFNDMKLNVFRGGKLVYQSDVDRSLVNLLTKIFNPKTKYSMNAVRIFNDLNTLSNMPKHRSSEKSRMVGSSVTHYNNANELADRMKVLIGSIAAGNNSPGIKNDLSQINDELLRINAIDHGLHEKFYQKYLS